MSGRANIGRGEECVDLIPFTDKVVVVSINLRWRTSTFKPKWARKSAPIIAIGTSAIRKIH